MDVAPIVKCFNNNEQQLNQESSHPLRSNEEVSQESSLRRS